MKLENSTLIPKISEAGRSAKDKISLLGVVVVVGASVAVHV